MKRLLLVAAFSIAFASPARPQQPSADVQQGLTPFGTYQGGDIDSVNLATGNVSIRIPLLSYPQRGGKLGMSFSIISDNKGWYVANVGNFLDWRYPAIFGPGGAPRDVTRVVLDQSVGHKGSILTVTDFQGGTEKLHLHNIITSDGASHEVVSTDGEGIAVNTGETIDATGFMYYHAGTSPPDAAIDSNGVRHLQLSATGELAIVDPNGNQITYAGPSGWTDTLGRVIPGYPTTGNPSSTPGVASTTTNCPSGTAYAYQWNVPAYNGATAVFKFCYANYNFQTSFNEPPVIEYSGTTQLLNAVVLPNLNMWQFTYDSYCNVTSVTFPTGGSITYAWTNATIVVDKSRVLTSRTLNANDGTGTHTSTYQWKVSVSGQFYNIATDPAGNDTLTQSCADGRVCLAKYYSGSYSTGTLLKTVTSQFHSEADPYTLYLSTNASVNIVPLSETTAWANGKTAQTNFTYDPGFTYYMFHTDDGLTYAANGYYGKPTLQTSSDYGQGQPGPIVSQNSTTYQWQADSNYTAANLLNLVKTSKVLDGGGNTCAETDDAYDDPARLFTPSPAVTMQHVAAPGPKRGNVSSITQQLTATPCSPTASWRPITSYVNAYDTGTTYQSVDPLVHTTTYTYSPTFYGAYPTQVQLNNTTTPGVSGSVQHISSANYDFNTGFKTSATDENANSTSFQYDTMWRLTQSSFPDTGVLTFAYQDASPFGVTVTRKITSTQNQVTAANVDGVGRLSQTQFVDPNCNVGSGLVKTDFAYTEDTILHDRLTKASTPYCDTPGTIYGLMTVNHSDALGRSKSVVQTDGSTVTTTYSDNQTTVSDEAGKSRKSQTDGLGRLTFVWEDPAGLNYETDYQYDTLGNLLRVDQKGGTTDSTQWRTRTFSYDSLSRLLTASNPESGTITYSYNDDGTLVSKTAPKPNQSSPSVTVTTNFTYDEIHRLTSKSYTDGTTPTLKYIYDGVSLTGCTPSGLTDSNPKPNRTSMCDAAGASAWSHDVMGRILSDQRTTNGVTKTTTYSYNLNGSLATLTYPSGRVTTYAYNNAARPISGVDVPNSVNYATAATYAPQGALASLQNGGSLVSTMYFNNRLQPCRISVKNTGTAPASCTDTATGNVLDFTYGFNLGAGDNGRVFAITNNRDTTRSQSFTYDVLNRIATAQTTSTFATSPAHCWGETFQYDGVTNGAWGNLTQIAATANSAYTGCSQESGFSKPADGQNHLSGLSYDASGNTTSDGVNSYAWDAEGQLSSAGGVNYLYDGDGRRVQKSSGKLYWYGMGSDPLDETDLTGSITNSTFNEYIFFGSARIARRDSSGTVDYYFSDHLGSARIVTNASGTVLDDSDFYPFGVERPYSFASGNVYKFEKKERDNETGNDDFGARYYSNRFGRWLSADWSAVPVPVPVPYANPTNPQTLNLYSMVSDDPESFADLDGHCPDGICMNISTMSDADIDKQAQGTTDRIIGMFQSVVNAITSTANSLLLSGDAGAVPSGFEIPKIQPGNEGQAQGQLIGNASMTAVAVTDVAATGAEAIASMRASAAVPDANVVVRGGAGEMPPQGTTFSGAHGATVEDAAQGVPHGQIRTSTAGEIRGSGGSVKSKPELTRSGKINEKHVNIREGTNTPSTFSKPKPNPVPKKDRID